MMNMYEIVARLNEASKAYYNGQDEIMSNKEWDSLFDELKRMEAESGIILPDSPTQKVGAPLVKIKGLKEERHEFPALSLDKTQDFTEYEQKIRKGMGDRLCNSVVLMWKMDGSTIQLTYENGRLLKMATRGDNGEVGYLVTHNASIVNELPLEIPYKGKLVVRGECVMSYAEFDRLKLEDDKYKNARNLANATITMLDTNEASKRELHLRAFNLVYSSEFISDSFAGRLSFLQRQGFGVVPYDLVNIDYLQEAMNLWTEKVEKYEFPVDGLVTAYDDARYADTLSSTNHHPHILRGYAFKWQDKEVETTLRKVEWSPSLNSLNPVAIFDSVELEGTTVSRASLHNVTYLVQKGLHVGNRITVYKANMIIPQVAKNLDKGTDTKLPENIEELFNTFDIPRKCPVCGADTTFKISDIRIETDIEDGTEEVKDKTVVLICTNPDCSAKKLKKFSRFVQRGCMNIKGISEETIAKFIAKGFIKEYSDFYNLDRFKDEIVAMDGFGEIMYQNIIDAVNVSRNTDFVSLINALGIPNIAKGQAKILAKEYNSDVNRFFKDIYNRHCFSQVEGIGEILEGNLLDWGNIYLRYIPWENDSTNMPKETNLEVYRLLKELEIETPKGDSVNSALNGKVFVITGKLEHFANRDTLVEKIEKLGGKVSGSVSAKTSFLINNDVTSTSGKNKKAKELNIPIISEEDFLKMM